jgi:hypothetical protein
LEYLSTYESIPILGMRWFLMKVLKILRMDRRFYNYLFFEEIDKLKLKHKELES